MEQKMFFTLCLALFFSTVRCRDVQDFTTKTLNAGEDVTLKCKRTAEGGYLFWKKLVPGNLPEVLGATYTFDHVGVDRRPRTETKQESGAFVLRITQTELSDTAFYYCEEVAELETTLWNITLLRIKGPETEVTAIIQYFGADPVGAENSEKQQFLILSDVQKNKTCPGGHKVLWFTPESNKSHPSVVYVDGNSDEEWDMGPEADPPQKCVHHLSRLDINSSNAGTFYCAVATCGEIPFRNGVAVEKDNIVINKSASAAVALLSAALALSLIVIILLLHTMKKDKSECFKAAVAAPQEDVGISAVHQQSNQTNEEGLVYSLAYFTKKKQSRSERRDANSAGDQSIYAEVRNQE